MIPMEQLNITNLGQCHHRLQQCDHHRYKLGIINDPYHRVQGGDAGYRHGSSWDDRWIRDSWPFRGVSLSVEVCRCLSVLAIGHVTVVHGPWVEFQNIRGFKMNVTVKFRRSGVA